MANLIKKTQMQHFSKQEQSGDDLHIPRPFSYSHSNKVTLIKFKIAYQIAQIHSCFVTVKAPHKHVKGIGGINRITAKTSMSPNQYSELPNRK